MDRTGGRIKDQSGFRGLDDREAALSCEKYGSNRIVRRKRKGLLLSYLESFGDPMIKILLIAVCINIIFLFGHSDVFESLGIIAAILLATVVSTLSEYGSEKAFEQLQNEAAKTFCRVQRAKGIVEMPVEQVVTGDIVLLQSGDRIPAAGSAMTMPSAPASRRALL